jgi:hypothetical protein
VSVSTWWSVTMNSLSHPSHRNLSMVSISIYFVFRIIHTFSPGPFRLAGSPERRGVEPGDALNDVGRELASHLHAVATAHLGQRHRTPVVMAGGLLRSGGALYRMSLIRPHNTTYVIPVAVRYVCNQGKVW